MARVLMALARLRQHRATPLRMSGAKMGYVVQWEPVSVTTAVLLRANHSTARTWSAQPTSTNAPRNRA
jgi:hypothetical protein